MTRTLKDAGREKTADRLLKSAAGKFYDPDVDIDWDAPLVEGKRYILEERSSLYGTELWDKLTPEQRIELGKHEVASVATTGLWFEILLMQMLLKEIYEQDPTTKHAQFALTEIADECPLIIGQIPLEILDFVVDMSGRRLIGNPEHGGEQMIELYTILP